MLQREISRTTHLKGAVKGGAALAAVLATPLDTHVFYGQPNEGVVDILVTEERKAEIRDIVSQFATN